MAEKHNICFQEYAALCDTSFKLMMRLIHENGFLCKERAHKEGETSEDIEKEGD